jgi:hypothetical protein
MATSALPFTLRRSARSADSEVPMHLHSIVIKLYPEKLANPDLDLRYLLPDLIVEKSGKLLRDDGYDYGAKTEAMLVYLTTDDVEKALPFVLEVIENETVKGNRLKDAAIVAAGDDDNYRIVYPPGYSRLFDTD